MESTTAEYRFGECVVAPIRNEIRLDGRTVRLEPKTMDVLAVLLSRAGDVLSSDELLDLCWPGVDQEPNAIAKRITQIRKALDDDARAPRYIETVYKRGYRTKARVQNMAADGMSPGTQITIGILPVRNRSNAPESGYFCAGLQAELLAELTLLPRISVISAAHVPGLDQNAAHIDESHLYYLDVSVTQVGDTARTHAALVEGRARTTRWSGRWSHTSFGFDELDRVTQDTATAIDTTLVNGERSRTYRDRLADAATREAFYRGLYYFNRFTPEDHVIARRYFAQAIDLDPDNAAAHLQMAQWCQQSIMMCWAKDREATLETMKHAVDTCLAIDERDASALGYAGMYQLLLGNHDDAVALAHNGVEAAPEVGASHYTLGWYQLFNDQPAAGAESLLRSIRLTPLPSAPQWSVLGTCYRNLGNLEQAAATLRRSVSADSGFAYARIVLASVYQMLGNNTGAREQIREALEIMPSYTVRRYVEPNLYRNKSTIVPWANALRTAGLPEGGRVATNPTK